MLKLRKPHVTAISIIALFIGAVVYSYSGVSGFYVPGIDIKVCNDDYTCLHETAHGFDNGRSEMREFADAVQIFRIVAQQTNDVHEITWRIVHFPGIGSEHNKTACRLFIKCEPEGWGGYSELYAEIYAMAGGITENIPEVLRPFYK